MGTKDDNRRHRGQLPPKRFGKDELNLADWPISVSQYEQRLDKNGAKVDYVERVLDRPDGTQQKVSIQAPSRLGLPTPVEEDVLVALLFLAKEQRFESDKVKFVPADVLAVLRWPNNKNSYDRLQVALHRLQAVSICYELTWYSKLTSTVEPVLMTGILAEAKLVRRKRGNSRVADSHIQWTDHFYTSLKSGNLTNLDLDLYFSLKRPGSRQLFRHLNKTWHAGKKPRTYGRDLKQIACAHLGMTDNKDLKRNFDRFVQELESVGYLQPNGDRYTKVSKGVWRATFDLNPDFQPAAKQRSEKKRGVVDEHCPASMLVDGYNAQRFGGAKPVRQLEIDRAAALLEKHDFDTLVALLPRAARETEATFRGKDKYFGAACDILESLVAERSNREQADAKKRAKMAQEAKQRVVEDAAKRKRLKHYRTLRDAFTGLSEAEKVAWFEKAITTQTSSFIRNRLVKAKGNLSEPPTEVLDLFFETAR